MKILFFSDAHLGANDEHLNRRKLLLDFLQTIGPTVDRIVINGDLFDFWFEYKHAIPKGYIDILSELYFLRKRDIRIDYVAGNHDFWMDTYLSDALGINIYKDDLQFNVDGKSFYIFHGDGLAKKDVGYRILKKIFRFRPNIWLYRWLHPDIGVPLAKMVSHTSRQSSQYKDLNDQEDYYEFASQKGEEGFDFVILGHRHSPELKRLGSTVYVNLGDWITHFSYAIYENGEIDLRYFSQ